MTVKSEIRAAVSRIERAPNMSRIVAAYDAAVGGSDVSVHRTRGTEWQVWHGEYAGFTGRFSQVRTYLSNTAEEQLEREAEKAATVAPAMVSQPAQMQQANAGATADVTGYVVVKKWLSEDGVLYASRFPVVLPKAADAGGVICMLLSGTSKQYESFFGPADRERDAILDMEEVRVPSIMFPQPVQQAQARDLRCPPAPREIRITARGRIGHPCVPTSPEAFRWIVTDGRLSRECTSHQEAIDLADDFRVWGYVVPAVVGQPEPATETVAPVRVDHVAAILDELVQEDADAAEIAAIYAVGPLGGRKVLAPGRDGIDVFDEGDDSKPYTTLPRGLPPRTARLLIDYWERGYERGLKNGAAEIQSGMKRLLGVSAP